MSLNLRFAFSFFYLHIYIYVSICVAFCEVHAQNQGKQNTMNVQLYSSETFIAGVTF